MSAAHRLPPLLLALTLLGCPKGADRSAAPAASSDAGSADFRLTTAPMPGHPASAILLAKDGHAFIEILGADFPDRVHVDEPFMVRTYIRVLGAIDGDGVMRLQLINPAAKANFDATHPPMTGAYPTSRWRTGDLLVDTMEIKHLKTAGTQRVGITIDLAGASLRVKDPPAGATLREKYEVPLGTLVVE